MMFVVEMDMEGRPQRVIKHPEFNAPGALMPPIAPGVTRYVLSFGGNGAGSN
jgi:hypothetical protein